MPQRQRRRTASSVQVLKQAIKLLVALFYFRDERLSDRKSKAWSSAEHQCNF